MIFSFELSNYMSINLQIQTFNPAGSAHFKNFLKLFKIVKNLICYNFNSYETQN